MTDLTHDSVYRNGGDRLRIYTLNVYIEMEVVYSQAIDDARKRLSTRYLCSRCRRVICGMTSKGSDKSCETRDYDENGWQNGVLGNWGKYEIQEVIESCVPIEYLLFLEHILYVTLWFTPTHSPAFQRRGVIRFVVDVIQHNPHVHPSIFQRIVGCDDTLKTFRSKVGYLNQQIQALLNEWEYTGIYDSYIEWLPHELMEELIWLLSSE